MGGHVGKHQGELGGRERSREGEHGQRLWFLWLLSFLQERTEEAKQADLRMVALNYFGGLWGMGPILVISYQNLGN